MAKALTTPIPRSASARPMYLN